MSALPATMTCVEIKKPGGPEALVPTTRAVPQPKDGEILTACQQSCPTEAIVFGDRNDLESRVAKRQKSPLDYVLLAELNTRPRTTYQALIRNPNPAIAEDGRT